MGKQKRHLRTSKKGRRFWAGKGIAKSQFPDYRRRILKGVTEDGKSRTDYLHINENTKVSVIPLGILDEYRVIVFKPIHYVDDVVRANVHASRLFSTKAIALKFAKDWMKSHPGG